MSQYTFGTEQDPRLNQPDIYCCECGEPCGRGAKDVGEKWFCLACISKDEDGPDAFADAGKAIVGKP